MAALFGKKKDKKTAFIKPAAKAAPAAQAAVTPSATPAAPVPRGPLAKEGAGGAYRILVSPIFTEKASHQQSLGQYAFMVAKDANKAEVAAAVRDLYGVRPAKVRIVSLHGKLVHFGRVSGKRKDEKKAIVVLKPGESITIAES